MNLLSPDSPGSPGSLQQHFSDAACLIQQADSLIIAAGAGMGVDSGLPDFRGDHGFWKAYPALGRAKLRFDQIASPASFEHDPVLAWGFYGHRLNLYRATQPHAGFLILQAWMAAMPQGGFVFTSNVDGQFQKAGFAENRMVECHGSIHYLQCFKSCTDALWSASDFQPEVDEEHCRLLNEVPRCIHCGGLARPAILMFDDWFWCGRRTDKQTSDFELWRQQVERPIVIEMGAGTAVPSVRMFSRNQHCPIIRINPTEYQTPRAGDVGIPLGALAGLRGLQEVLSGRGWGIP